MNDVRSESGKAIAYWIFVEATKAGILGRSSSPPTLRPTMYRLSGPYFAARLFKCGISRLHGSQYVAQKSSITARPARSPSFCTRSSSVTQLISVIGFAGGIGRLVVGRSLIETGRLDTETGVAAGRQPAQSKRATAKRQR